MSVTSSLRLWLTRGAIASLVGASMVAGAAPAHAVGIGPVEPISFGFDRSSDDGSSVVVHDGESASIVSKVDFLSEFEGFPFAKNSVLTRTAFNVTLPDDVTSDWQSREWYGFRSTEDETLCDEVYESAPKLTITNSRRCIDYLQVYDTVGVQNDTGSTQTIQTNAASQVVKNGKKTISNAPNVYEELYAQVHKRDVSSVTLEENESSLTMSLKGCIDESLLNRDSQELSVIVTATEDGSTLTEGESEDYIVWDVSGSGYISEDLSTFTTPRADDYESENGVERENLEVYLDVYIGSPTASTYTATLDVKNVSNQSVLEECGNSDVLGFPTVDVETGGNPSATAATRSLPAATVMANDDFNMYAYNQDGFGGLFYWNLGGSDNTAYTNVDAKVVHMSASGATTSFNGSGYFDTTTGVDGDLGIFRYDTDGSKWFSLSDKGTNWSMTSGTMSAGSPVTKTLTAKAVNKMCPTGFTASYLWGNAAATTAPTAQMWCELGSNHALVLVNLSTVTKIATLGTTSKKNPCVVPVQATSAIASSDSDIAIAYYTRVSTKDVEGYCTSIGSTTKSRSITTVTKAGVATTTSIANNPWGADGEPYTVEMAPADASGSSWIGVGSISDSVMWGTVEPTVAFSLTSNSISVSSSIDPVDLPANSDNRSFTPIKKISSTKWLIGITNTRDFDGVSYADYTQATLNPSTGVITMGDTATMYDFGGYPSARIGASFSIKSGDSATWFVVTGEGTYKSTTWTVS